MVTASPRPALADHDSALRPVAAAYRNSPPDVAVLAIACRALTVGMTSKQLRLWLTARGTPEVKAIAKNRSTYGRHIASARKRVAASSSLDGRAQMRVRTARRIVGCMLSPLPPDVTLSAERNARARHALAILGAEFMKRSFDDGYDTIVMGGPWLAVEMGCTRRTALSALNAAIAAGWIRKMPTKKGAPQRFKLLTQLSREQGDIAWCHSDVVDALVDGDNPAAEVLALAAHPAVGYGETAEGTPARVGHFAWLVGLADEAGVDPVEIGMTARTVGKFRRAWLAGVQEGDTLTSGLDAWADGHGSDFLRDAALDAWAEARDARKTEIETHRERRAALYNGLAALLSKYPIPKATANVERRNAWVSSMSAAIEASGMPDEMRSECAKVLASKMRVARLGYPEHVAAKVAAVIAGAPAATGLAA